MSAAVPNGRRRRAVLTAVVAALVVLSGCSTAGGDLFDSSVDRTIDFREVSDEVGLAYNGSGLGVGSGNAGVYALDYDNDGWQDLFVTGAERPALFRNTGGEFERVELPALDRSFKSAAVVDVERDGWTDLILFGTDGAVVSLRNDEGSFERTDYGFGNLTYPLGATAADYDGDGDTDLFVFQSGDWREHKPRGYFSMYGKVEEDNGNPNVLYENTGDGFERVTDAGIEGDRWSLAASFVDLTGDGRPDVHVANDYNNDTVYVNQGDGTFEQRLLGGATARNGMASEIADVDADGRPDVFVSNIHLPVSRENMSDERYERIERLLQFVIHSGRTKGNSMLVNQGDGEFVDRADEYGVRKGGWGWAASLVDLDNDGDRDLIHTTQDVVRIDRDNPVYTLPMVYERDGEEFTRLDADEHGLAHLDGRGMVTVDFDHDGDQDFVAANFDGPFAVYENTGTFPANATDGDAGDAGNSVAFEVVDGNGATALGATVRVEAGGDEDVVFQTSNTDYLSHDPYVEHVGLGETDSATLHVTWPDGTERTVEVAANRRVEIAKRGVTVVANTTR